jgi:cytosine/adenosine deaminase-related metal-dependent hydrolase
MLYISAAKGGAQALNRNAGNIVEGQLADLVAIDSTHPSLCALTDTQLLDGLIFAANDTVVTDLWSAGRHAVRAGAHIAEVTITRSYHAAIKELAASLNVS